jgi:hypothetical protein
MGTLIMKCTAIVALLLGSALGPTLNLQVVLGFLICAAAVAVATQAVRAKRYVWAAMFFSIALIFNPVFTFQPVNTGRFVISAACVLAFLSSIFLLRNLPKKSILSITGQSSGSDPL